MTIALDGCSERETQPPLTCSREGIQAMAIDLATKYMGLTLRNPLVVSSCMLTGELDVLERLEGFGAAAAVLPSLFEEQLADGSAPREQADFPYAAGAFGETLSYFRELQRYNRGPERYLQTIESAKKTVRIPIIASLNGSHDGDWLRFAKKVEAAGADAIELNSYAVVTDPAVRSEDVEAHYVAVASDICKAVSIPVAVKLSPFFTSLPNIARRLVDAGASGLVLFNRFLQPD